MSRFALPLAGVGALAAAVIVLGLLASNPGDVSGPGTSGTPQASPSQRSAAPSAEALAPLGYRGTGTIAFTLDAPSVGDTTTWLVAPDGSGLTQLVVDKDWPGTDFPYPGTGCCEVFSPDGISVAVGYDDTSGVGGAGTWLQTRILGLDGANVTTIPTFCGGCGSIGEINYAPRAWSPDGSTLAIEVWSDDDPTRDGLALAPAHEVGWTVQLAGNHRDVPIAFSPDGSKVLFARLIDGELGTLMVLTIPEFTCPCGGQPLEGQYREIGLPGMVTTVNDYFGAPASWSPDGQQIAFAATDPSSSGSGMRIWVVDADGGEPVPITRASSLYTGAAWSPDGQWIAFDRRATGQSFHDAYVIRPDGSGETNLTESFAPGVCCPRWSPDSSALLTAGTNHGNDASYLFIVPIDGSPVAQVTTVPGTYTNFSWGPASR